jgi:site-specific DNA recombinase
VQAKLAAQALARRCRLRGSPALLTGRLFDDRGNRMSPAHTNKGGARYRYYVSQAVLQRKPLAAGAIGRVPAAEIEVLISAALRRHLQANGTDALDGDRELFERHVERVTLSRKHIHLQLRQIADAAVQTDADEEASRPVCEQPHGAVNVTIPWTSTVQAAAKGIIHVPAHNTPMTLSRRDALLMAIAKARNWADELAHGRLGSFAVLAEREGKVERHIRLLVPLAFLSPRIVSGLLDGTAPARLTITALARALPWSWAEQERRLGLY